MVSLYFPPVFSQQQMAELFDKDSDTIGLHIRNAYKEGELQPDGTTEDSSVVQNEGTRNFARRSRAHPVMSEGKSMRIELSREEMEMARKLLIEHGDHMAGWLINESLKELELFLNTIEDFIEKEEIRELSNLDKFLETIPETNRCEFLSEHYPYEWQQILGAHFRSSFIITLMSVTEDSLSRICTQVSTMLGSSISNKDLKGSILEAAKKYLQAIGNYQAPPEHHWTIVIDLYKVRNVIVHNGGMLEGSPKEKRIRAFMEKAPGISAPQSAFLKFEKEFCFYALEQVKGLFSALDAEQEKLRLKIKEANKT